MWQGIHMVQMHDVIKESFSLYFILVAQNEPFI